MTTLVETPIKALGNVRIESDVSPDDLLTAPGVLRVEGEGGETATFLGISAPEAKRLATLCHYITEKQPAEILTYVGDLDWQAMGERFERVVQPQL